jgi:DNA-directed RNA polymerase subunit beta'
MLKKHLYLASYNSSLNKMATTTVGRVLLKFFTPPEYHNLVDNEVLDQKGISKLFAELSEKAPDKYSKIVSDLTRLGFEISTRQGTSITLKDLVSPIDKDKFWDAFEKEQDKIESSNDLPSVKRKKIFDNYNKAISSLEGDLLSSGLKENKSLAKIVLAGSRGSPAQYRGTIATQGIVVDAEGNPKMDMPIKSSYAEGLSLPEFLVSSFGARTGEVLKKISVAQGGYGSKQFARALMPLQVVEYDCNTQNGIDVSVDDKESVGAYLAKPVKSYNRNNQVTPKMLNDLSNKGVKKIVIRSPMTCQSNKEYHSGGLCQLCVGHREKGLAAMDSYIGLVAGTAVAEPLTESAMKARHSGGAATSLGGNAGFKLINQLANVPKHFLGKAPLAQEDGFVTKVEEAAAGGYFITVNDTEHYIGLDQEPKVKVGDRVEEGDVLSTGLVDPRDVVQHRGIGEGRRYYMEAMKKAFDDSKLPVNRRNFELIAKAAIDHVQITDPEGIGDYLPDQIVSYSAIEKDYKPRKDSKLLRVDLAYGKYLEKPELHYTIGTKVTTAVVNKLKEYDIESVLVNSMPPNFEPAMVRLLDVPEFNDDWMHVLNSTNLAKRFIGMVNKGSTSDTKGPSPIPGLAYGVGFGLKE